MLDGQWILWTADAQIFKKPRHSDFALISSHSQTTTAFWKDVLRPSNENCSIAQCWIWLSLWKAAEWKILSFIQDLQYYADVKKVRKIVVRSKVAPHSDSEHKRLYLIKISFMSFTLRCTSLYVRHRLSLRIFRNSLWNIIAFLISLCECS